MERDFTAGDMTAYLLLIQQAFDCSEGFREARWEASCRGFDINSSNSNAVGTFCWDRPMVPMGSNRIARPKATTCCWSILNLWTDCPAWCRGSTRARRAGRVVNLFGLGGGGYSLHRRGVRLSRPARRSSAEANEVTTALT